MVITDRGRPAHVLLGIEAYGALTGEAAEAEPSILDLLADPNAEDVAVRGAALDYGGAFG